MSENAKADKKWSSEAGPIQTKKVSKVLGKFRWEASTYDTKTGIIGGEERVHTSTLLVGGTGRTDCTEAATALGERFAWKITRENYQQVIAEAEAALAVLEQNRPVKDERETADQVAARQAEYKQAEANRQAADDKKRAVMRGAFGGSDVKIEKGQVAISLVLCCDKSDGMSDYSHPHATLAHFTLQIIGMPKAETEALARGAVSRYPDLEDVAFTWHSERYSGGHGNYLMGEGFELPPDVANATGERIGHWEVQFRNWDTEPMGYRGYPGLQPTYSGPTEQAMNADGVIVRRNLEHDGVEIVFPSKPDAEVLARVKGAGFRWSMRSKVWYKRFSGQSWAEAHQIVGLPLPTNQIEKTQETPDRFDMQVEDNMARSVGLM